MPTIRALRTVNFLDLKRIDEPVYVIIAPRIGGHAVDRCPIGLIRVDAADWPLFLLGALNFPFLPTGRCRILADKDDYTVGPLDAGPDTIFPILVIRLLHRHIDELERLARM